MSIVVRFTPVALTAEKYDTTIQLLGQRTAMPPDGLDYHVCFGSEGNLFVSEIWDSPEQFTTFGATLLPILSEAGIQFSGPPEPLQVHNIMKR